MCYVKRTSADGLHTGGKARHFARRCVLVIDAFGDATHQFWLCLTQSCQSSVFVSGCNCFFYFAQKSADARATCLVHFQTTCVLAGPFFCLRRICHGRVPLVLWVKILIARTTLNQSNDRRTHSLSGLHAHDWCRISQVRQFENPESSNSNYLSRNCASRFSRNAVIPSVWSSVANRAWKERRSNSKPSFSEVSSARFTHSFTVIDVNMDFSAIF